METIACTEKKNIILKKKECKEYLLKTWKPRKGIKWNILWAFLMNASLLTACFMTDVDTELLNKFVFLDEELIRNNEDEMTVNYY